MNKFNRKIISIVLVILTILAMFMLEKFTDENKSDKVYQKIDLTQNYITDCTIDINDMGIVKYYIEPNIISVYLRIKVDKNAKNLAYTTENLDVIVSQGTKKGIWPKLKPEDELEKNKKNIIPLNLELRLPNEDIHQYNISQGKVKILSNQQVIGEININIINSKYSY